MLDTSGYTVAGNMPLTHARILYDPIVGAVTASAGTGAALAANDFTFQRWQPPSGFSEWSILTPDISLVDTVFIAAHNLAGRTIRVWRNDGGKDFISPEILVLENSTIAIMTNDEGDPWQSLQYGIDVSDGENIQIGVIRFGLSLQMQQPVYGGVQPIGLNRIIETRHSMSETGQWLGRTVQRQARRTQMDWTHLKAAWYRQEFEPFSLSLPQKPFGIIQNPAKMPESVAWCWTDESPTPSNMGIRDYMQVSLGITGFLE